MFSYYFIIVYFFKGKFKNHFLNPPAPPLLLFFKCPHWIPGLPPTPTLLCCLLCFGSQSVAYTSIIPQKIPAQ